MTIDLLTTIDLLIANGLFENVNDARTFAAGTRIFSEGNEPGGLMYVVQEGEVDIFVRGELVDTLGPGTCLGEIGLVDNRPRSATAVAKVDCILIPIDRKRFNLLIQETPHFALQVMKTMADRLRLNRDY